MPTIIIYFKWGAEDEFSSWFQKNETEYNKFVEWYTKNENSININERNFFHFIN